MRSLAASEVAQFGSFLVLDLLALFKIHYDPVERGFVDLPDHWRWSSARDYAGFEGLQE